MVRDKPRSDRRCKKQDGSVRSDTRGSARRAPRTDFGAVPKSMVRLNDRPIVDYQVCWMQCQGVTDVVFLTGYLGEKVEEHFGDGSTFGITAHYSHEDSPLGRGGASEKVCRLCPTTRSGCS